MVVPTQSSISSHTDTPQSSFCNNSIFCAIDTDKTLPFLLLTVNHRGICSSFWQSSKEKRKKSAENEQIFISSRGDVHLTGRSTETTVWYGLTVGYFRLSLALNASSCEICLAFRISDKTVNLYFSLHPTDHLVTSFDFPFTERHLNIDLKIDDTKSSSGKDFRLFCPLCLLYVNIYIRMN